MTETTKAIRWQKLAMDGALQVMTLDEAAELLNVHRAYFLALLDTKELPMRGKAAQRRLRYGDVLAYRDAERQAALRELTELSEDAGLYDADYRTITHPA